MNNITCECECNNCVSNNIISVSKCIRNLKRSNHPPNMVIPNIRILHALRKKVQHNINCTHGSFSCGELGG
jgi:hypothetical protein